MKTCLHLTKITTTIIIEHCDIRTEKLPENQSYVARRVSAILRDKIRLGDVSSRRSKLITLLGIKLQLPLDIERINSRKAKHRVFSFLKDCKLSTYLFI